MLFWNRTTRELDRRVEVLREVRRVYDERIAFGFCALQRFFNLDEEKVSEILAFFLDPHGDHTQRGRFLREFLLHFDLAKQAGDAPQSGEATHLDSATVAVEDPASKRRRIDIVVRLEGGFRVGIENKLDARDQPKQLSDYAESLQKQSGGNYRLFYLTPDGHSPSEESIAGERYKKLVDEGRLRCIGYKGTPGVIGPGGLLAKFEAVCLADNVRAFIRDFARYIGLRYVGGYDMGEIESAVELLKKTPELVRNYHIIEQGMGTLR